MRLILIEMLSQKLPFKPSITGRMLLEFQVILQQILSRKSLLAHLAPLHNRPTVINSQESKLVTFCYQQCGSGIANKQFSIHSSMVQTSHLGSVFHTSTKQSTFLVLFANLSKIKVGISNLSVTNLTLCRLSV